MAFLGGWVVALALVGLISIFEMKSKGDELEKCEKENNVHECVFIAVPRGKELTNDE